MMEASSNLDSMAFISPERTRPGLCFSSNGSFMVKMKSSSYNFCLEPSIVMMRSWGSNFQCFPPGLQQSKNSLRISQQFALFSAVTSDGRLLNWQYTSNSSMSWFTLRLQVKCPAELCLDRASMIKFTLLVSMRKLSIRRMKLQLENFHQLIKSLFFPHNLMRMPRFLTHGTLAYTDRNWELTTPRMLLTIRSKCSSCWSSLDKKWILMSGIRAVSTSVSLYILLLWSLNFSFKSASMNLQRTLRRSFSLMQQSVRIVKSRSVFLLAKPLTLDPNLASLNFNLVSWNIFMPENLPKTPWRQVQYFQICYFCRMFESIDSSTANVIKELFRIISLSSFPISFLSNSSTLLQSQFPKTALFSSNLDTNASTLIKSLRSKFCKAWLQNIWQPLDISSSSSSSMSCIPTESKKSTLNYQTSLDPSSMGRLRQSLNSDEFMIWYIFLSTKSFCFFMMKFSWQITFVNELQNWIFISRPLKSLILEFLKMAFASSMQEIIASISFLSNLTAKPPLALRTSGSNF